MNKSQMEQAFVIASQLRRISQQENMTMQEKASGKLSMQAIVDTARFPLLPISEKRRIQINQNIDNRRLYSFVLKKISEMQSVSQVAASSASTSSMLVKRKGEGFELKVVADPDNKAQGFLLVKLATQIMSETTVRFDDDIDSSNKTGLFLHCEWEDLSLIHI